MKNLKQKIVHTIKKSYRLWFIITGIASVIWFLIRVIPKPSRAAYPCQRASFPIASGFIIWLSVNLLTFSSIKKLLRSFKTNKRFVTIVALLPLMVFYILWLSFYPMQESYALSKAQMVNDIFEPIDSANSPTGVARGIFPGRVVWVRDTTAAKWNGSSGYWWEDENTDQGVVSDMLSRSLQHITGKDNDMAAWDTLFRFFNYNHDKGNAGYQKGEKIVIKLSLVQSSDPSVNGGNKNFTPPQTVLAMLRQLVYNAGVNAGDITFYDIMRSIPASVSDRCKAEFPEVHFVGSKTGHNQEIYVRDTTSIHWSEELKLELTGGHTAYLPTIITKASYMINLAQFKGHRYVGVTGCAKNHFGSMSADGDVNTPHAIGLHPYVTVHNFYINGSAEWSFMQRDMGTYNALVDLMGNKDFGEKTLLFMVVGLYGVPYESAPVANSGKWLQPPFNNYWTSSIFISLDDVALESVLIDLFRAEQAINPNMVQYPFFINSSYTATSTSIVFGNIDNFLHEASQADNPPSGTYYAPNKDGVRLPSLGVHEHWNNADNKQYSRNLGTGDGIELNRVAPDLKAPSNLNAERINNTTISLLWTNDGENSGSIIVYRSLSVNTNFKPVDTLAGDETSYTDLTASNTLVYYRLKKITPDAYSWFSNESKVDTSVSSSIIFSHSDNIFHVYPNPANDYLYVQFNDANTGTVKLELIDIQGKTVWNTSLIKNSVNIQYKKDLANFRKGFYTVRISIGSATYHKKLLFIENNH